jgi:MFS family permease
VSTETGSIDVGSVMPEAVPQPPVEAAPLPIEQPLAPRRFRTLGPLAHRNFAMFWGGAMVSNVGTWLQNVALSWLVLEITAGSRLSPFWVSMVTFCMFFPTLLFGLFGGLVADRLDRRRVLLVTQTIQMSLAFALAIVVWSGHATVATLLPIIGLAGVSMAFNAPSFQAIIPDLIPQRLVMDAVSLNSTQWSVARVFGPALGGYMLKHVGAGWAFFSNGASFLAVIAVLLLIRTRRHDPPTSTGARALFGGVRSARETPAIAVLLGMTAIVSLFGAPVLVLLPVMAKNVLGLDAGGFGGLFALFSVGAVGGALSTATLVRRIGLRAAISGGLASLAVLVTAFGFSTSLPLSACLLMGVGAVYTMLVSATNTGLQMSVPNRRRGRIMSLYMMAWGGLYPVGALLAGIIATQLGAPVTLRILAVPLLLAAIWLGAMGARLFAAINLKSPRS